MVKKKKTHLPFQVDQRVQSLGQDDPLACNQMAFKAMGIWVVKNQEKDEEMPAKRGWETCLMP